VRGTHQRVEASRLTYSVAVIGAVEAQVGQCARRLRPRGVARVSGRANHAPLGTSQLQNSSTQKLICLISLCTNPVSILSVPIQTVR
jgi:hypothetical protein